MSDVFKLDNIINWKIDKAGEFLHASYESVNYINKHPETESDLLELLNQGISSYAAQSELNKRSSRAAAIHSKYKLSDIGIDVKNSHLFSEATEKLLEEANSTMLRCEHDRWNVFQMLDGWEAWDRNRLSPGKHKDNSAKLHAYLAEFNELMSIAQEIYGDNENPIAYDQIMVGSARFTFDYAENGYPDEEKREQLFSLLKEYAKGKKNEKIPS